MTGVEVFFYVAVFWFSFVCLRIAVLIRRFLAYPGDYGRISPVPLASLAEAAEAKEEDLPSFRVVIPAYREGLVIDGTLRRLATQNYPRTHFEAVVVTYADETVEPGEETTFEVASRTADQINAEVGRDLIRFLCVPEKFDGEFPGTLDADRQYIGKARGLNFALRSIHEWNEREERTFYIGRMSRLGQIDTVDRALDALAAAIDSEPEDVLLPMCRQFDPSRRETLGPCVLSRQVERVDQCLAAVRYRFGQETAPADVLSRYLEREAPRFFLHVETKAAPGAGIATTTLNVMQDRRFLHDVMRSIEALPSARNEALSLGIEAELATKLPRLHAAIESATDGEQVYQLARRISSRWVAVYDADADPPVELFRHLAARILRDPGLMGFQGPVAPVANYDAVHPLCRLGGLSMGYWHSTGYPLLMSRKTWAHVLAGTNWCFRIEGFRQDERLIHMQDYDESKRQFLLSFDPRQLTEDLEVAVRVFNDWHINAEWHPLIEYEQVPATPRAMIVQRRRWTLGTLQTLSFIFRSKLPLLQRLKFALLPLDVVFSGSGPIITIVLWVLIHRGDLLANPVLVAWSIVLTFGNLLYVVQYLLAHERFVIGHRRAAGVDYLLDEGPALTAAVRQRLEGSGIGEDVAGHLDRIAALIETGTRPGGVVQRHLAERSQDAEGNGGAPSLLEWTPTAIRQGADRDLAGELADLAVRSSRAAEPGAAPDDALIRRLSRMEAALEKATCKGPWRRRRRRERSQIWRWAFVYLFWQLIPYYGGLIVWLAGGRTQKWEKTPRTRKANLATHD